jgi:hypothetical protein
LTNTEKIREAIAALKADLPPRNVVELALYRQRRAYNEWNARLQISSPGDDGDDGSDNAA